MSLHRGESKASMDVSLLPFDLGPRSVVLSRLTFDSLAVTLNGGGSGASIDDSLLHRACSVLFKCLTSDSLAA